MQKKAKPRIKCGVTVLIERDLNTINPRQNHL
jgi:hypothetical protein